MTRISRALAAVAAAVSYLVSDAAGMVTGQVLKIDGGSAMR